MTGVQTCALPIFFSRPRYEYEPEPEPAPRKERRPGRERREEPVQTRTASRAAIDIPVEDGPRVGREPPKEEKKGFFNRSPRVPSPDQLLKARQTAPTEPEEPEEAPPKAAAGRHTPAPDPDFPAISKPEPITQPGERAASHIFPPEPAVFVPPAPEPPATRPAPVETPAAPPPAAPPVSPPIPPTAVPTPNALLNKIGRAHV